MAYELLYSHAYWCIHISISVFIFYLFPFCNRFLLSYFHISHLITFIYIVFPKGKSYTLGYDTAFSKFQDFRNDAEKRYFTPQSWIAILFYVILSCVILSCLFLIYFTLSCLVAKMLFFILLPFVIAVYLPLH